MEGSMGGWMDLMIDGVEDENISWICTPVQSSSAESWLVALGFFSFILSFVVVCNGLPFFVVCCSLFCSCLQFVVAVL